MRVATVFTGVAACTATFMPAAGAATGQHMEPVRPDIQEATSCKSVPHWVHFVSSEGAWICYGYAGKSPTNGFLAETMCGGNNYGRYKGWYSSVGSTGLIGHDIYSARYGPGTTYVWLPHTVTHLSWVSISRWKGSDAC
jgi:hypothetical protein